MEVGWQRLAWREQEQVADDDDQVICCQKAWGFEYLVEGVMVLGQQAVDVGPLPCGEMVLG